jgi:poly-beta-1,6-N-acetyl-D-glucosamine synthase
MQTAEDLTPSTRTKERGVNNCTYVLITPARNEAKFIELTIQSVLAQTIRPVKWIIVSDGSTDGTDDVVRNYAEQHNWIELVRRPERKERTFAAKVNAFNAGYHRLDNLDYDLIANLDADISFDDKEYFEFLISRFAENPRLGIAGTSFREGNITYPSRLHSIEDVLGACQMFRRECFVAIGGYQPISGGGIDMVAVLAAQAAGWQTQTFTEKLCIHHRAVGSAHCTNLLERWLHTGRKDYLLGSHPAFEIFRCAYQMAHRPYVIGGVLMLLGYFWVLLRGVERPIPQRLVNLRRSGQIKRLQGILRRALWPGLSTPTR